MYILITVHSFLKKRRRNLFFYLSKTELVEKFSRYIKYINICSLKTHFKYLKKKSEDLKLVHIIDNS